MATVVVAGSLAQRPGRGGHAWVFLNYLLGLEDLGHEVHFVDRLDGEMLGSAVADHSRSPQAEWLDGVMDAYGFGARYTLLVEGASTAPEVRRGLLDRLGRTDLLIDVNGFLRDPELLAAPAVAAFLDIDPAIQQMWVALGLADLFSNHDLHFSVGLNVGSRTCRVPTCGFEWIPTLPPVAIGNWRPAGPPGGAFTSVASWRGPYGPIEFEGESYGLKVHEFRRMWEVARVSGGEWELALDIDPADAADAAALQEAGWRLLDPMQVAGDPASYRSFVHRSKAEIGVAQNVYVRSRCGWFSDRSACYLASGRPVLAQETGFSDRLPSGEGLLSFGTVEEAVDGAARIDRDWRAHARAAQRIADEYLDARKVLGEMLAVAGV